MTKVGSLRCDRETRPRVASWFNALIPDFFSRTMYVEILYQFVEKHKMVYTPSNQLKEADKVMFSWKTKDIFAPSV